MSRMLQLTKNYTRLSSRHFRSQTQLNFRPKFIRTFFTSPNFSIRSQIYQRNQTRSRWINKYYFGKHNQRRDVRYFTKNFNSRAKFYIPFGLTLGITSCFGYIHYSDWKQSEPFELVPLAMPEPAEFIHPYDSEPWYKQMLYKAARMLYLGWIFAPVSILSVVMLCTNSDKIREYWLELLVNTLEKAGCTFQKYAQICSMRPDMFPQDVIEALTKLRDHAPKHSMEHTKKEIKASFGKDIEEIFEFFEETPVASGTVAQVHAARLRPEYAMENGKVDVAVKIRHPNVIWETFADLDLVFKFTEQTVDIIHMAIPFSKQEFKKCMQQQIDFKWEAYNMLKFDRFFASEDEVQFPKISLEFLSDAVLVESWMPGKSVHDMFDSFGEKFKESAEAFKTEFDEGLAEKKVRLAGIVHEMCMKMFLRDNFMHGDLHGGNILISQDGSLTVLDTGIITSVKPDFAPRFGTFLRSLTMGDREGVTSTLLEFRNSENTEEELGIFVNRMENTMNKFVAKPGVAPGGGMVDLGDLLGEIMFNLSDNGIRLRSDVAASIQSMSISEGLIRMLDPEFDVCKKSLPFMVKYGQIYG